MKRREFLRKAGMGVAIAAIPVTLAAKLQGDVIHQDGLTKEYLDEFAENMRACNRDLLLYGTSITVDGKRVNPMEVIRDGNIYLDPKTNKGATVQTNWIHMEKQNG